MRHLNIWGSCIVVIPIRANLIKIIKPTNHAQSSAAFDGPGRSHQLSLIFPNSWMLFSNCKTHQFRKRRMLFALLLLSKALNYFECCSKLSCFRLHAEQNDPYPFRFIPSERSDRKKHWCITQNYADLSIMKKKQLRLFTLIIFNNPRNFIVIRNGSHVPKTVSNLSTCVCTIRSAASIISAGCFFLFVSGSFTKSWKFIISHSRY